MKKRKAKASQQRKARKARAKVIRSKGFEIVARYAGMSCKKSYQAKDKAELKKITDRLDHDTSIAGYDISEVKNA